MKKILNWLGFHVHDWEVWQDTTMIETIKSLRGSLLQQPIILNHDVQVRYCKTCCKKQCRKTKS